MFGPVSESDLAELEARRSGLDNDLDSDSDTITGASLSSIPTNVPPTDSSVPAKKNETDDDGIRVIHKAKDLSNKDVEASDSLHVTIIKPNCFENKSPNDDTKMMNVPLENDVDDVVSSSKDGENGYIDGNTKKMCDAATDPEEDPPISGKIF